MRKKIFRGKRVDTGEWIYGYYVCVKDYLDEDKNVHVIIPSDTILYPRGEIGCIEFVDPNTVTQYVNKTDSKGNMIFEGDIVNIFRRYVSLEYYKTVSVIVDQHTLITDKGGYWFPQDTVNVEVIGNIYDNFDLLSENKQKWVKNIWFKQEV